MGKRKIIVVEAISSSANYISDIRERGYEPVLLETWVSEERREARARWHADYYNLNGDVMPEIIMAPHDYEETLELVKQIDPVLILPGADHGLYLALRLSADLGLCSNDPEKFSAMRNKSAMQAALKEAGLRYIDTAVIHDMQDALRFYQKNGEKPVIVKYADASASVGVLLCHSEEEVAAAVEDHRNTFVDEDPDGKIIIQEYIDGTEYVVDTISCRGEHRTIFAMEYEKKLVEDTHKIYDTDRYIDSGADEYRYLSDYIFGVLDAIGIKYGPVHSEIMVDEKGPVLIEVNCRPAGASVKRSYQDRILGCHETREALDAYLDPEDFSDKVRKYGRYGQLLCPAMVKNMIMPRSIFVKRLRFNETAGKLKSYVYMRTNGENCVYEKTVNLNSNSGMIFLANEDEEQLKKDCEYLQELEMNDLGALYEYEETE